MQYAVSLSIGALAFGLSACTFLFSPGTAQNDAGPQADAPDSSDASPFDASPFDAAPDATPACEQLAPLRDLFAGQEIDSKWKITTDAEQPTQENDLVTLAVGQGEFQVLRSPFTHDLTSNSFYVKVEEFGAMAETWIGVGSGELLSDSQAAVLSKSSTNKREIKFLDSVTPIFSEDYPLAHVYLRIREQDGWLHFGSGETLETIEDFKQIAITSPFSAERVYAGMGVFTKGSAAPTQASFGRVNEDDPETSYCKTATLVDGFNSPVPSALWSDPRIQPCDMLIDNLQLRLTLADGDSYCTIETSRAFDLRESEIEIRFAADLPVDGSAFHLTLTSAEGDSLSLRSNNGEFSADIKLSGQTTSRGEPQSLEEVTGIRIRHHQGLLDFHVISKGEYELLRGQSPNFSVQALRVTLGLTGFDSQISIGGVNAD